MATPDIHRKTIYNEDPSHYLDKDILLDATQHEDISILEMA